MEKTYLTREMQHKYLLSLQNYTPEILGWLRITLMQRALLKQKFLWVGGCLIFLCSLSTDTNLGVERYHISFCD